MFLIPKGKWSSKKRQHTVNSNWQWSACGKVHGSDKRYTLSNTPSNHIVCQLCDYYNNFERRYKK